MALFGQHSSHYRSILQYFNPSILARRWEHDLSDIFQNPAGKFGDASANTGQIGFGTANAPTDDSAQEVFAVLALDLHGSAGIALDGSITHWTSAVQTELICEVPNFTWQESLPPSSYPAHMNMSGMCSLRPAFRNMSSHFLLLTIGSVTCTNPKSIPKEMITTSTAATSQ